MGDAFQTTRWSLLVKVRSGDERVSLEALDQVCRRYWPPVYAWLRASGNPAHEAEELTQDFFAHALNKELFTKADASKGRLRSLLLTALKHHLSDLGRRAAALKRGGENRPPHLPIAEDSCTGVLLASPDLAPDALYERRWAHALLERAIGRLEEEHAARGKEELFRILSPLLSDIVPGSSYAAAAADLGTTEGAVRVAFHRMRTRFREIFREEVAATLTAGEDLEEEIGHLFGCLAG